ncbi:hypothetical protein ISN44_As08g030060 [Arabidopsis suecica]|uniref:Retrovirus-related Pol polyprotein from transposon TNT 1-94-like beta-barrel domain-containing protein n=1 Tax=Arabidopsis suecica TaxID=45249 RepID=A0A8T2B870_ARASU|nr:hypothetical protein ISN44_As08g030060 [Arabidopsis suecica]
MYEDKVMDMEMDEVGGRMKTTQTKEENSSRYRGRGSPKSRYDKSSVNCGKFGRYASECKAPSNKKVEEKANYIEEKIQEEDVLLMASYKKDEREENHKWYLNIGASNHMCGRKSMFAELDVSVKENVALGDESKIEASGVRLEVCRMSYQFAAEVYEDGCVLAPDMLISISLNPCLVDPLQLISLGYVSLKSQSEKKKSWYEMTLEEEEEQDEDEDNPEANPESKPAHLLAVKFSKSINFTSHVNGPVTHVSALGIHDLEVSLGGNHHSMSEALNLD